VQANAQPARGSHQPVVVRLDETLSSSATTIWRAIDTNPVPISDVKRLRSFHLRQQRAGGLNVAASGLDPHDALPLLFNSLFASRDVALGVVELLVQDGAIYGHAPGIRRAPNPG
jgi:hypothetical protein